MEIQEFTIRGLAQAVAEGTIWQGPVHPITRHRALAQLNNPRADPDDVVLLVAYEKGVIVSYLGILPDKIFVQDGEQKIGWLTCWWADPKCSGIAALRLLLRAIRAYPEGVGSSAFTKRAAKVYEKMPQFTQLSERFGILGIVRPGGILRAASQRYDGLQIYTSLFDILVAPLDWGMRLWQRAWVRSMLRRQALQVEYLRAIDQEASDFIEAHRRDSLVKRGRAELNWLLHYPWVLTAPVTDRNASKYFFSATARQFYFLCFKVYDSHGEMVGLVILRIRDQEMAVPYVFWRAGAEKAVAEAIVWHMVETGISIFRLFNEKLVEQVKNCAPASLASFHIKSRAMITDKIMSRLGDVGDLKACIQDGDGDNAFT